MKERERERGREKVEETAMDSVCVLCVVCVWERERERTEIIQLKHF
jgi:hypothetical protein